MIQVQGASKKKPLYKKILFHASLSSLLVASSLFSPVGGRAAETLFQTTMQSGDMAAIRQMLKNLSRNSRNELGEALVKAALKANKEVVALLIQAGADPNYEYTPDCEVYCDLVSPPVGGGKLWRCREYQAATRTGRQTEYGLLQLWFAECPRRSHPPEPYRGRADDHQGRR